LIYLARSQARVWANKLIVTDRKSGSITNGRPGDLPYLTHYLSHRYQRNLRWLRVSIDEPSKDWTGRITFLSSRDAIKLSGEQIANLKRWIDGGGILLCNPDKRSGAFILSMRALATQLYPNEQAQRKRVLKHPLFAPAGARKLAIEYELDVVEPKGKGAIIILRQDWARAWQTDLHRKQPAWELAARLYAGLYEQAAPK